MLDRVDAITASLVAFLTLLVTALAITHNISGDVAVSFIAGALGTLGVHAGVKVTVNNATNKNGNDTPTPPSP
jgi:isocitrate dehydrogenase